jgi:hypothetical protein
LHDKGQLPVAVVKRDRFEKKILLCVRWNYEGLIYYKLVPDLVQTYKSNGLIKDNRQCRSQRESASKKKVTLCAWWNYESLIYYEIVVDGRMVNAEVYSQQLEKMYMALLKKIPSASEPKERYFNKITLVHTRRENSSENRRTGRY